MKSDKKIAAFGMIAAAAFASAISTPATAVAQDSSGIETITVVAQKRTEDLQEVPISMQVVSAAQIEAFHEDTLRSLQNSLPNVYVTESPGNDSIYIRGFGSNPSNFSFDPSVSTYEDGIYAGHGPQFMAPFFDVDHVEVLRGPQGALFGKNTAAGAVSIVTANPTKDFQAQGTASYNASYGGTEDYGYVSGPLSDKVGARLAVKYVDENGWVKNIATGANDPHTDAALGRGTLKFDMSDNFDVTTKVEYDYSKVDGYNTVTAPITAPAVYSDTRDADNPFGQPERDTIKSVNASATANLRLGSYTLTSVTGYSHFTAFRYENAGSDDPALYAPTFNEWFHQFSEEIRLLSPTGERFEYVVGGYYDNSTYHLINLQRYNLLGGLLNGQLRGTFDQTGASYSAYGQGTYHILSSLRLIGSLRYSENNKTGSFVQTVDFGAPLAAPLAVAGQLAEPEWDPSATLQYDIANGVMLYATYGHGSKAGGFVSNSTAVTAADFRFQPEKSTNYEAGVKSTFDDNRMVLNLSVYDTKFRDLQVSDYDPTLATFITGNAATATSKGFEAFYQWKPMQTLDFKITGAYTDANYDNFPGANCLANQTLAQCNPASPTSIAANNIGGTPLPFTAKWTGDFQAHMMAPLPADLQLDVTADVTYRSQFYNTSTLSPIDGIQPAYAEINLRVQVGDGKKWNIAFVGSNLTNHHVIEFSNEWPVPLTTNTHYFGELQQTRSLSIEGTYRF